MPVSHLQRKVQKQKSLKVALKKAGFVKILPINNNFFSGMMGMESNSGAIVAVLFSDTSDHYQIEVTRGKHKQKLEHIDKSELDNELKSLYKQLSSKATASAERKWKFKDGSVIMATTIEEAKAKHKVTAADKKAQDASKVKDSIKKVLGSLGLSYTEDNWGDFSVKTIFGKVKIDFDEYRNNIKVRWSNIFSKIYGEDDDVFYSLKISDSNSASKIKEMLEDILKLAELDKKVNKKYAFSAPSWL